MALCRVLGRYKMYVDPDDWDISPHLMFDGYWEPRTTEAIVDRLAPGMTAIDVGANVGYFSILMAALVGPHGRVLSFEPNPAAAHRMQVSLTVNGFADQVSVHANPLGDEDGRDITLYVPPNHPGGTQRIHVPPMGEGHVTVPMRRLDGIPGALDAALVKIDVEGMEETVWRGMPAMLAGSALRWIVIEFSRACYVAEGAALIDEAMAAGFSLNRIDDRRGVVAVSREEILSVMPSTTQQMLLLER